MAVVGEAPSSAWWELGQSRDVEPAWDVQLSLLKHLGQAPCSFTQNSIGVLRGTRAKWKSLREHLGRVGIAAKSKGAFLL